MPQTLSRYRLMRAGALVIAVVVSSACGERGARRADGGQRVHGRLDGTWDVTLRLDRRMSLSNTPATLPFSVHGTLTMMANDQSDVSFSSLPSPTAIGVYAVRLDSLGLLPLPDGVVPTVAARERMLHSVDATARDSIVIVLNPAASARTVRLMGTIGDELGRGDWSAESPLGGGGTLALRRVHMR